MFWLKIVQFVFCIFFNKKYIGASFFVIRVVIGQVPSLSWFSGSIHKIVILLVMSTDPVALFWAAAPKGLKSCRAQGDREICPFRPEICPLRPEIFPFRFKAWDGIFLAWEGLGADGQNDEQTVGRMNESPPVSYRILSLSGLLPCFLLF